MVRVSVRVILGRGTITTWTQTVTVMLVHDICSDQRAGAADAVLMLTPAVVQAHLTFRLFSGQSY